MFFEDTRNVYQAARYMAKYDSAGVLEKIKMMYPIAAGECQVIFPAIF